MNNLIAEAFERKRSHKSITSDNEVSPPMAASVKRSRTRQSAEAPQFIGFV
jgi:hypothetical protein